MEYVSWRGTPGVGDFMWALNCVHRYCYENKKQVVLEFHWEHDENHLHHFEDPETIIERLEYIHNFYHRKDDVQVKHVYGETTRYSDWKFSDDFVREKDGTRRIAAINRGHKNRFYFESGAWTDRVGEPAPISDWTFRPMERKKNPLKIVIWRPTFNAELPRTWKRLLTHEQWDDIISLMRQAGLHVVELTYRTPVREAMYHLSTCRQVVCYDGMWHYIARNFQVPMVILSSEGITSYHTPHCVKTDTNETNERNIYYWINNLPEMLGESKKRAVEYEQKCKQFYQDR